MDRGWWRVDMAIRSRSSNKTVKGRTKTARGVCHHRPSTGRRHGTCGDGSACNGDQSRGRAAAGPNPSISDPARTSRRCARPNDNADRRWSLT